MKEESTPEEKVEEEPQEPVETADEAIDKMMSKNTGSVAIKPKPPPGVVIASKEEV